MLRDTADGLEVFLIKRHGLSDVLGGAYVFPGGKVDAADAHLDADKHLDQTQHALQTGLNEPELSPGSASAIFVAAAREAFEESGILFVQEASPAQTLQAREMLREGVTFDAALARTGLRLDTRSLLPWSRWITPKMPSVMNKRFDTRFFVAAVPPQQTARHDDHEATESIWLTPRAALVQYWEREIELAPPQIMSLAHLNRHTSVSSVLEAARQQQPPVIQPEPFDRDGMRVICYPGDERHSLRTRALPGPTRLVFRDRRFEPEQGFDAFFC